MASERNWTKATTWSGKALKGVWKVTIKIDGVRAFWTPEGWVSRAGKPLYNIPPAHAVQPVEGYEVYHKVGDKSAENFKATLHAVRAPKHDRMLTYSCLHCLDPLDSRLVLTDIEDPSPEDIQSLLAGVLGLGHEGLILRQAGRWLKVKPFETFDVEITGFEEGVGKHKGRLGAVTTPMGKVGTGFTDAEREEVWRNRESYLGTVLEASCMHLTEDGLFRHPAFICFRIDKSSADADVPKGKA